MKAMIMAAGVGSRLMPLTTNISKPMVPVANLPAMAHIVNLLRYHGVTEAVANLHYKAEAIDSFFKVHKYKNFDIHFSYEQELMGTAGGVKKVESFLNTDTFIIISGDAITDIDLTEMVAYHKSKGSKMTIALKEVDDTEKFGVVVCDENMMIKSFQEKPKKGTELSNLVNAGIYIMEPEVLEMIPSNTFYDFGSQLFPLLVKNNISFYGYRMEGYWCDIGSLSQYHQANRDALAHLVKLDIKPSFYNSKNIKVSGDVLIGDDTIVEDNVIINGPCVIGNNCHIGEGSILTDVVIWHNVRVGKNAHLSTCVVGNECYLYDNVFIADGAILSDDVQVLDNAVVKPNEKIEAGKVVE